MADTQLPPCDSAIAKQNSSGNLYAATSCILVISMVLLGLRLYARSLTTAKRGWDEFLLPISWVLLVGLCAICYLFVPFAGVGRHIGCVLREDPKKLNNFLELIYILDWVYVPSNCLSRLSVVLLFLRVFVSRTQRVVCWVICALLIANCVATLVAANVECIPLEKAWNSEIPGTCFNVQEWWKFTNLPNVILDGIILLLPVPTVWSLKASVTRKTGISFVFLAGSIGLAASSARTSYFFRRGALDDTTYGSAYLLSWTIAECGMYFNAACLIGLRPLLSTVARRFERGTPNNTWRRIGSAYTRQINEGADQKTAKEEETGTQRGHSDDTSLTFLKPTSGHDNGSIDSHLTQMTSSGGQGDNRKKIRVQTDIAVETGGAAGAVQAQDWVNHHV